MKDTTAYRVSVRKFQRMIAVNAFGEDRVELLGGILTMMTSNPEHDYAVTALGDELSARLPRDRWTVRREQPVLLGSYWRPMPDIAVVRGDRRICAHETPRIHEIALLVEVSDTTYPKDTGKKRRQYEKCGVACYWVVDLNRRRVEVREMTPQGLTLVAVHGASDLIPLQLDGQDFEAVPVRELLP